VPTEGATYDTLRGRFEVIRVQPFSLTLKRADGRYLVAALSDWPGWSPTLVSLTGE